MSEATSRKLQTWVAIIAGSVVILSAVKIAGANDQVRIEHERRITAMESKFEMAMERQSEMAKTQAVMAERQAIMADDLKIIRDYIQGKKP